MTKIEDEFHFINKITPKKSKQSKLVLGIGDDAALFHSDKSVDQIVCVDTMVENVHFSKVTMKPFDIGYKVLASNISDIAAMGGKPLYYLVSIAIPSAWSEEELLQIYDGMYHLAGQYDMDLIGGDTVSIKENLVVTVTVIGEIISGKKLLRSNAKNGDIVFVSGTIGDASAGLEVLLQNEHNQAVSYHDDVRFLIKRHQQPTPRVDLASLLVNFERVSLNDISDGLASELNEIAEASCVTIFIETEKLPLSKELCTYAKSRASEFALYGGEDFELVGTISSQEWSILKDICEKYNIVVTAIGKVQTGNSEVLLSIDGSTMKLEKKGYNHFK